MSTELRVRMDEEEMEELRGIQKSQESTGDITANIEEALKRVVRVGIFHSIRLWQRYEDRTEAVGRQGASRRV